MKRRFLCPQHAAWLMARPQMAMKIWAEGIDSGLGYYEGRTWRAALPQFGCAYETADMLLSNGSQGISSAVARFVTTAVLLINCCAKLGELEMAEQFFYATMQRLAELESVWGMETEVLEAMHQLRFAYDDRAVNEMLRIKLADVCDMRSGTIH